MTLVLKIKFQVVVSFFIVSIITIIVIIYIYIYIYYINFVFPVLWHGSFRQTPQFENY